MRLLGKSEAWVGGGEAEAGAVEVSHSFEDVKEEENDSVGNIFLVAQAIHAVSFDDSLDLKTVISQEGPKIYLWRTFIMQKGQLCLLQQFSLTM